MPSRTPPNTNANTMRLIAMELTGDPSASDPGGRWPCRAIPRPSAGKNAARLSEEEPGAARLTREGADQHDDQEESETAAWIVAPARPVRRGGQRADGEQRQHDEKDQIHGRLSSTSLRVSHRCGELGATLRSETTLCQRLPSFPALRAVEKTFSTSRCCRFRSAVAFIVVRPFGGSRKVRRGRSHRTGCKAARQSRPTEVRSIYPNRGCNCFAGFTSCCGGRVRSHRCAS